MLKLQHNLDMNRIYKTHKNAVLTGTRNIQEFFKDIIFKAASIFACHSAAQRLRKCILV
jgi:hypothetical protein